MTNKSKLAIAAVIAALSIASPALAQSYDPSAGTGNVLPFAYGAGGVKQRWTALPPANAEVAVHRNGLGAYARVPRAPRADVNPSNPALSGGGSTGYNEMLLIQ
jgi:hypothetical protein